MIAKLETHPFAEVFPEMKTADFESLKNSIQNNGCREDIVLFEGKILDGRHRQRACIQLGIVPNYADFEEFDGGDALQYVLDLNLERRHLSVGQRSAVAAKIANLKQGGDRGNQYQPAKSAKVQICTLPPEEEEEEIDDPAPVKVEEAAEKVGVSKRSVESFREVEKKDPELAKEVASGQKTINKARGIIKARERKVKAEKPLAKPKAKLLRKVIHSDCLDAVKEIETASIPLIYTDPPFNTGKDQTIAGKSFSDSHPDYLDFLRKRMREAHRILADNGSIYLHLDYREVHYAKLMMDDVFGRNCFQNEIIWAYDYGGRAKNKWAAKHDTILFYSKDPKNFFFDADAVECVDYASASRQDESKPVTDVWNIPIVHPTGEERVDYPTQKPVALAKRIIKASSKEGDVVLDMFAGSGTVGDACIQLNRGYILIDQNKKAIKKINERLA